MQLPSIQQPAAGPLGMWYADPLDKGQARALLAEGERRRLRAARSGRHCLSAELQQLVAHHWLGRPLEGDYQRLALAARGTAHGRALVELIYGQLLMSRRLRGAMRHLERGFSLAHALLAPADYFLLLKRHSLLGRLPLGKQPLPAESLHGLLATAAVIARLQPQQRPKRAHDPDDLYG